MHPGFEENASPDRDVGVLKRDDEKRRISAVPRWVEWFLAARTVQGKWPA